jgi:hypothetical protein
MIGEQVVAAAADHPDRHPAAEFSGRASLVGPLAARDHAEPRAQHRFARRREVPHRHYEIHVETADNGERRLHRAMSMPSFFNSSA